MKLQHLTVIFIIIIIPIILLVSLYISTGLKTINYQSQYDSGMLTATYTAIHAFEQNTANDEFSANPEEKRDILKASINMFEKSLCSTCNISSYNTKEIEDYIPAIVFGMYDGFYMYAPSKNIQTGKYEHGLKNYVYYSETLGNGIIIRYSLDNYVVVSGYFESEKYQTKKGYLIDTSLIEDYSSNEDTIKYSGIEIEQENIDGKNNLDAVNYYKESSEFTKWFNDNIGTEADYLYINSQNNPEDETSPFVQHKRTVIKNKMENVLNSSITAYSSRLGNYNFKMPKLSEEDWQKVYSNISMITFFQGKNIGLTKYNGYCVLNSTNNNEYVNPNLMYFIDGGYYHDIRCTQIDSSKVLTGYKIGEFRSRREEVLDSEGQVALDADGKVKYKYTYKHNQLACYECVNGSLGNSQSVYNYIKNTENENIKKSYYTSLARERYNTTKL